MEEKIKIIDEIVKRHPSYGVDKGWSYYIGGMKDSGDWYFRKMLDVPIEELQSFLNDLITQENKPKIESIYSEQDKIDMGTWHETPFGTMNEYSRKKWIKLHDEIESKFILWGK